MSQAVRKPAWLKRKIPLPGSHGRVQGAIDDLGLHTVCREARCPNRMECYACGTATFLLLGPSCTRRCTFCAVDKSAVGPPDPAEPEHIAQAVARLGLSFCVLTMVTRDDLADGGAAHVAATVQALRGANTDIGVELLISDLGGNRPALETVLAVKPQVLNHNIETVPRLYPEVRPQADFQRSLDLLANVADIDEAIVRKSGIMLGLGETEAEVVEVFRNLLDAGCHSLTLGQYLAPSREHHPVAGYVPPERFEALRLQALSMGFKAVASGPFVRSSYQAEELYKKAHG